MDQKDLNRDLLRSVIDGTNEQVREIIESGANPNCKDDYGYTPLHWAAFFGATACVSTLIQLGANINEKNDMGSTPLHLAAENERTDSVSILIQHGANINEKNTSGSTPLHLAAEIGRTDSVSILLQHGANINEKNTSGSTPLHLAAEIGRTDSVSILLQHGANINEKNTSGSTPLHLAAEDGRTDSVSILFQHGAKVNKKNTSTELHSAARLGIESAVLRCIQNGALVNNCNTEGSTPLHLAAENGRTDGLSILLQHGANINEKNIKGSTPLHLAAENGRTDGISILLQHGANINEKNIKGSTPLHLAAENGRTDGISILLQHGANINEKNIKGQTPLHLAAAFGSKPVTVTLLKNGSLFDEKDRNGKTAYDIAESLNRTKVLRLFKKILSSGLPRELLYLSTNDESTFTSNLRAGFYLSFKGKIMTVGFEGVGKTAITSVLRDKKPSKVRKRTDGIDLHIYRAAVNMDTWEWEMKVLDLEDIAFRDLLKQLPAVLSDMDELDEDDDDENDDKGEEIEKVDQEVDDDDDGHAHKEGNVGEPFTEDGGIADPKKNMKSSKRQQSKSKLQWLKRKLGLEKAELRTIEDIRREAVKRGKKGLIGGFLAPVNMMDFGGQAAFYSTHQIFLTYRGIYLLGIDGSRDFDAVIESETFIPGSNEKPTTRIFTKFWVRSIVSNSKGSSDGFPKILPVCTHRDKVLEDQADDKIDIIYNEIEEMFKDSPAIRHLVLDDRIFLNAMDPKDPGYKRLKAALIRLLQSQPSWGEKLPKPWIYLKLCIHRAVEKGEVIMSMDEMKRINQENPVHVLTHRDLQLFLKMQHAQGEIIYFPLPGLRDHIVISPKFLVDVLRSLITEKSFCKGARFKALESLNQNGILMKKDAGVIWRGKLTHDKEYLQSLLEHLDVLATPRRYNASGGLIESDFYYVPSLIRAVDNTDYLQKRVTSTTSISVSFRFAYGVLPPAIGYRLISSCIDMYELQRYNGTMMLFSGMVVLKMKNNLDLVVILKCGRVNISLVHTSSRFEIVLDTANGVLECLKDTLTNILESYRVTASGGEIKHDVPFVVEFPCDDDASPCYRECTEDWTCQHGHRVTRDIRKRWFVDREIEGCLRDCEGLSDSDHSEKPTELHLAKLSLQLLREDLRALVIRLGLKKTDIDKIEFDYGSNLLNVKFLCLRAWKRKTHGTVGDLIKAIEDLGLDVHTACKMKRDKPIPELKDTTVTEPTDRVLDAIANEVIDESLLLAVQLGHKASSWLDMMHQRNKIVDINREVLVKWRENQPTKGGIRDLSQALCNVDVNITALLSDLK